MTKKAIFIAATGQNVGKTTLCLGLIALLKKHFSTVGFIKPVGQQHQTVDQEILVDKDVILFKEHFQLEDRYQDMSPVILPKGATKRYLDGEYGTEELLQRIHNSFTRISEKNEFTLVEGTGHVGVGSIVNVSNARVAKELGLEMVLIAKGGLGSAFDELALNKALCDAMEIKIRGIILNKIIPEKKNMIVHYFTKALERWDIPLLGALPYDLLLSTPTMTDFAALFKTELLAGQAFAGLHFEKIRLVATSVETFLEKTDPKQLIVTPATREDIVFALTRKKIEDHGLILTGHREPSLFLKKELLKANIPSIYAPVSSFEAMKLITSYTAKIRGDDKEKIAHALRIVSENINFNKII